MSALARPGMALIDLDGTLIDTVPDLTVAVDAMLRDLGCPPAGDERVREWVGNGVERLVKRALTGELEAEPPEALYARAFPLFERYYGESNGLHSRPFPGVEEGLTGLAELGVRLACVTNKAARYTAPLLEQTGLTGYFELVLAGDSLPRKKPDPLPLLHAAEAFGLAPAESLMVGDSISDVHAAREAGFAIVCVSYGYNHGMDIRDAAPDAVVDSLAEIPGLLSHAA